MILPKIILETNNRILIRSQILRILGVLLDEFPPRAPLCLPSGW